MAVIQTNLPDAKWGYVSSKLNPADCTSRGMDVFALKDHLLWWKGSPLLRLPSTAWLKQGSGECAEVDAEQRTVKVLVVNNSCSEWECQTRFSCGLDFCVSQRTA